MPSFTRRIPASTSAPPPGTVPSPGTPLHLLPSGIPSLDDLFAGGLPLGSTWLVLAGDRHSAWGRLVARYWIAQGLCAGQTSVVVGEQEASREVIEGCMWLDPRHPSAGTVKGGGGSESEGEGVGGGDEAGEGKGGKKIAWRYDGLGKFKTTVGGTGHLTLTKTLPASLRDEMERGGQLSYVPLEGPSEHKAGPSRRSNWAMLNRILLEMGEKIAQAPKGQAMRITIHEFASADYGDLRSCEIHRFLSALRALLRGSSAAALITLPAELARTPPKDWAGDLQSWIQSLAWAVDACIEMRGFGDSPSLAPLYAPLHGLLTLHSFPTSHSLLPPTIRHSTLLGISTSASSTTGGFGGGGAGENNLGFRCSRKRLEIETVHLGIEGGTGERRTEPIKDVGSVLGGAGRPMEGGTVGNGADAEGVESPTQPPEPGTEPREGGEAGRGEKPRKPRRAVRFGGPEVAVDSTPHHAGPGEHDHAPHPVKPGIRHDKPELYDF